MEKWDRIRLMAIIAGSVWWDGVGAKEGDHTFELVMIVTAGERRGEEIDKRYIFRDDPPDFLCRDLLRLGLLVRTAEDLQAAAKQLIGIVVRVSLAEDGDTSRVYIDDYFGRDDPKKYRK